MRSPKAGDVGARAPRLGGPSVLETSLSDMQARFLAPAIEAAPRPSRAPDSLARQAEQQAALGRRMIGKRRYADAVLRLERAVRLDPGVAAAFRDLGLAYAGAGRHAEAAEAFRRAVLLDPDLEDAHRSLIAVLAFLGREEEVETPCLEVIRLAPSDHRIHEDLGHIRWRTGRLEAAEAAFRAAAAAACAAGSPRARLYEAQAEQTAGRQAAAEALLAAMAAENPADAEAHLALGQVQAELGKTDAAAASLERGLELAPGRAAAWNVLSINKRFTREDAALIVQMRACLDRQDLSVGERIGVHFALGKALDDLGEQAAGMAEFDRANRLRAALGRLDRELLERQTSHAIASTPPGFLERRPDFGARDETPILIVGMPRSGTTLVEQILSSHPDVAAGGELPFWRERVRRGAAVFGPQTPAEGPHRLAEDYLAVLRAIGPSALRVTDKTPFNFAHLGLIRQVFPRAMIVHCRRSPIDTCLSNYMTNFAAVYDYACDRGDLVFFYRQYLRLMAHWREALPPARFVEVHYEALVADPEPVTRALVAGCGLEWHDACLQPQHNRRAIRTASVWQARQPIYGGSVARWRRYEPWLGALRELIADEGGVGSPPTEGAA